MKKIILITILLAGVYARAQEMDSDLFAVLNNSSLSVFMKSAFTTMEVKTFRASKQQGLVEEYSTTYKKGKINPERINFTIVYTEYYLLEDRKKSLGKYELNGN
ncbi:MAG: hypothetical protein JNJ99_00335, partial [Crocinitomicaceae bacterium]|nr:hypothetical protein [Crocinitomicaceae bacterium]